MVNYKLIFILNKYKIPFYLNFSFYIEHKQALNLKANNSNYSFSPYDQKTQGPFKLFMFGPFFLNIDIFPFFLIP